MQLTKVRVHRAASDTPLRYPGGKTRLYAFLRDAIGATGDARITTYIEPYAGGVGAGISLLVNGDVQRLVINDLDQRIYSLWHAMLSHTDAFVDLVMSCPLTITEWRRQREIYQGNIPGDILQVGFAAFYLNRTNRSGVMNAGVIGGQAQTGTYKIDARFNREGLVQRIRRIAEHRDSVEVTNLDGSRLLADRLSNSNNFFYVDPPYFAKGSFLYMNSFNKAAHAELAQTLRQHPRGRWILTYDDVPEIKSLYGGCYQGTFSLPYSAHQNEVKRERMIVSAKVAEQADIF